MAHFTFLKPEWPALCDAASKAESLVYSDPRASCFLRAPRAGAQRRVALPERRGALAAVPEPPRGVPARADLPDRGW